MELFDTHFVYFGQLLAVFRPENASYKYNRYI